MNFTPKNATEEASFYSVLFVFFIASFPLVQYKCGGAFRIYIYLRCSGRRGGGCPTLDEAPVVALAVTDMLAHDHSIFWPCCVE